MFRIPRLIGPVVRGFDANDKIAVLLNGGHISRVHLI